MGGKASRNQRRAAQIQAERAARETRMKNPSGESTYAKKRQNLYEERIAAEERRRKGITKEEWERKQSEQKEEQIQSEQKEKTKISLVYQFSKVSFEIKYLKMLMRLTVNQSVIKEYQAKINQLQTEQTRLQNLLDTMS